MAIQIQYPFIDAVSVSLSASRGSPARLFTVGGSATAIPFAGKLIGRGSELAVGRNFQIEEFADNSTYLDQNNIILFRRGMPSKDIVKKKKIIVPVVRIYSSANNASVTFKDQTVEVSVQRQAGTDTLGEEDWADSPCAGSQVRYLASRALGAIGAPGAGNFWCSYEGQYRSVLSSIYSDIGCTYWWNFAGGGIGKICGSSGGNNGQRTGCNIISSVCGNTNEGTRSHSSFTYVREPVEEIRSISFTKTYKSSFSVSPKPGLLYPSQYQIFKSLWGGIDTYNNLANGYPPPEYIPISSFGLPVFLTANIAKVFASKFNWDFKKSYLQNWSRILGLPDLRTDAWGNVLQADDLAAGSLFLVKSAPDLYEKNTQLELYYPYSQTSIEYPTNVSSNGYSLNVKNTTIEVSPPASARGYNEACGASAEDLTGNEAKGLWRGVQIYSPDDAEEGILDFSNSALSFELQESIADCVITVSAEPFLFSETLANSDAASSGATTPEDFNDYIDGDVPGTLRYLIKRGCSIIWVRPPRRPVEFSSGGNATNCNDLSEVVGYTDPNLVATQTPPRQTSEEYKLPSICDSPVQAWLDEYGVVGDEDEGANVQIFAGLLHAEGEVFNLVAGNQSKTFVMPSLASYSVIQTISTEYEISAKFDAGSVGKGRWASKGSAGGGGFTHTVSVTDVTAEGGEDYLTVPNSNSGGGSIGYSKYTATDFCCPIDGLLESLNANIGPDGVSVSYSYRGVSPLPGTSQTKTSTKGISRGFVTVG